MFLRVKRSVQGGQTYEYLQIVEAFREAGRVRQRVRATLGRRDQLGASGALDGLLTSLARFSERLRVVEQVRRRASRRTPRRRGARFWCAAASRRPRACRSS
jgi:hypothetical protein